MNEKMNLAHLLSDVVQELFPEAVDSVYKETDEGFYCDYDLARPLNPQRFAAIIGGMKGKNPSAVYELSHFSGVYLDDDAAKKMLQRIYVLAFHSQVELNNYKALAAEAALHDHKLLGQQLKLFSSCDEVGQGLILWHPNGAMLRHMLEKFGQEAHLLNDYQWVYSPHIGKASLWQTSGHLDFYQDAMYHPIQIDQEAYYLKPMNCPFHICIYNSELRSYRELPMRLAEYGTVYRYELSGTLSGLSRVRGFTQDDAHIICTKEQIQEEVTRALKFSLYILRSFGFEQFTAYIATKPVNKSIGAIADWEQAIAVLQNSVLACGLSYQIDEGGGAFYGPKIDLKLKDSLNREWQCSTIQFDFNLPSRFAMSYIAADGEKHQPLMVHRALYGSFERFISLLIEHYKGEFPFWLSPLQFGLLSVRETHTAACRALAVVLKKKGFRVAINAEDSNLRSKIKAFELKKTPYMLIIGDKEAANGTFSVRSRRNGDLGEMTVERLCEYLKDEIAQGIPQYIFE